MSSVSPQALLIEPEFPQKLGILFEPHRYKVLYGGRGAGRSWGVARALLLRGLQQQQRVLCAREYQNSISESVHKVLSDQIVMLGLGWFWTVEKARIFSPVNGSEFFFEGIKNNPQRVKSYEGIDVCWVEEANKVSKTSWQILIPTIRKTGSEIWITFNPELAEDYTFKQFVKRPLNDERFAARVAGAKMTFADNPWFPEELRLEMEDCRQEDPDAFDNIWLGNCRENLEGAIYAKQLRRAREEGRICQVPWFRELPVDVFWDLGRADQTALWFGQRVAMQYRILAFYQDRGEDIPYYLQEVQRRGYTIGTMHLPHDAKARRLGSKRTIEEMVRQAGYRVNIVPKLSIADGINAARTFFGGCWFDENHCEDGLFALRHYRFKVIESGDGQHYSNDPLHDENSDGADAFRYMAVAMRGPGEHKGSKVRDRLQGEHDKQRKIVTLEGTRVMGTSTGWMG